MFSILSAQHQEEETLMPQQQQEQQQQHQHGGAWAPDDVSLPSTTLSSPLASLSETGSASASASASPLPLPLPLPLSGTPTRGGGGSESVGSPEAESCHSQGIAMGRSQGGGAAGVGKNRKWQSQVGMAADGARMRIMDILTETGGG
ncbi:unnamed protein product, partial [Discosporangium mesarthrocarpum]